MHPCVDHKPLTPIDPFGHGLTYTTYEYTDFKLAKEAITPTESINATVKVTNTGKRDGVEIVQLYIRDRFSSATRPVKELKDFARVALKAGESKEITFTITPEKLSFYDRDMKWTVEPGEFIVMVGPSSADEALQSKSFIVK